MRIHSIQDTQHKDTKNKDTQHLVTQIEDTQHNDNEHDYLSITKLSVMIFDTECLV